MIFFIFQQQKPLLHIGTDKVHRYYIFQLVWRCKHDQMLRCSDRETKYNALVIHRCMYIHRIPMLSEFFFVHFLFNRVYKLKTIIDSILKRVFSSISSCLQIIKLFTCTNINKPFCESIFYLREFSK